LQQNYKAYSTSLVIFAENLFSMQKFLNTEHEKAYNLMLEKDYQQALKIFDDLIYLFPNEANLLSDRGVIFIHLNKK
jgi:regulator of sirC expression with transglutaminase-like and TPR domain